jgi:SP family facilitated glucose transporter-like MFS transporter 8
MERTENVSNGEMGFPEAEPVSNADIRCSKTWPQHLAAALSTLSLVCVGVESGWMAFYIWYLLHYYRRNDFTYDESFWIIFMYPLGSLIGPITAGYLADRLGRRFLMLIMTVPMVVSWLMLVGESIVILFIAMFVLGFTCGVVSVASPMYSDEIAEVRVRGAVGSYFGLMFSVPKLGVYICAAILSDVGRKVAFIMLPFSFAVAFYWMPESPLYLLTKGQDEEAKKSLRWLRGVGTGQSAEIEGELREMQSFINRPIDGESDSVAQTSVISKYINFFRRISVSSATLKAINIIFGLIAFRQLCGCFPLLAFGVDFVVTDGSYLDPYEYWLIVYVVEFVSTLISIFIVDRVGRRPLLIVSGAGGTLSLLMLMMFISQLEQGVNVQNISWLRQFAVYLHFAAFSVGLGPVPWFMMPELLSKEARCWVSSLAVCFNWTTEFLVKTYL